MKLKDMKSYVSGRVEYINYVIDNYRDETIKHSNEPIELIGELRAFQNLGLLDYTTVNLLSNKLRDL